MPTLDWIGKDAVVEQHKEVPFRLLKEKPELSVGELDSGNMLIQGDNLEALKALLPHYKGKVKCIYIDPPYNTGNENWVYNDNVNSPQIQEWLGKVVGRDDLSRHDKWLCMMYPRLNLLKQFLTEDGSLWVSIDDKEVHNLRSVLNEIFGEKNFIASVIWQKVYSPKNSAKHFSEDHDYVIVYAKNAEIWRPNLVKRSNKQDKAYKNPDNDPRGSWKTSDLSARNPYSKGTYSITCPSGRIIKHPPKGAYWRFSKEKFNEFDADGRIWWGKNDNSIPQIKRFLSEVKQGIVPQTFWSYQEVGHTQEAKKELVAICDFEDSASVFITPKPTRLIKRILEIATDKDSLVLDSFAGTGSTAQAVLEINKQDEGKRNVILIEMEPDISRTTTKQRLQRVIEGYSIQKLKGKIEDIKGVGGGFSYYELGETIFDANGQIKESIKYNDLARFVFFSETNTPLPADSKTDSPLLGIRDNLGIYLLFNGILRDKSPGGGNALTRAVLKSLPLHNGPKVIYGTSCRLSQNSLRQEQITFKQIPYQIRIN
ncbi:SAM-dependent methyltransferase [Desulfonema limicola]|uniref:site-specific DNA-methyltransferase (adenine-specific) n=1 Tax=Desulfonema limicola TaxID=45656 RepID=A0A975B6S7_9BACT|nr:site-specific DNA-methyltransferase [Desulfonema limicola]QTA79836.1 SAM-dependent methyltransferase [Desulfonema limicola]